MNEVTPDLIEKAASGDLDAFSRLVENEYDFVFKTAWKWTRNRTDAEDIAQEVCLRLAQSISKFKGYGRFRTWLYSLVLNVVRDAVRKSSRDRQREEAWSREVVVAEPDDCDPGHALWEAVRCLPDKQKDAVLLVYGEGLSHSQASEILGITALSNGIYSLQGPSDGPSALVSNPFSRQAFCVRSNHSHTSINW